MSWPDHDDEDVRRVMEQTTEAHFRALREAWICLGASLLSDLDHFFALIAERVALEDDGDLSVRATDLAAYLRQRSQRWGSRASLAKQRVEIHRRAVEGEPLDLEQFGENGIREEGPDGP